MNKGVDISSWQGGLRISDIKKAGYDFAILRAGFTGYGENRSKNVDSFFESFYADAKNNTFPVGAYWYSCADSAAQGRAEAEYMYDNCLKGKQFEYPIYIDVEEERWQANNKKGVTDAIIAFCDYLEGKGYYVGVYASLYWFNAKIDTSRLSAYTKWVACWDDTRPNFDYNAFELWQYTSDAIICGCRVDADECYIDFPRIIKDGGFNGFKGETPAPEKPDPEKPVEPIPDPEPEKPIKEIKASQPAMEYNENLAGTYIVDSYTGLNVRDGAGMNYEILVAIPDGQKVHNYGYYTDCEGIRWLYIAFLYENINYIGFASADWLKK